MNPTDALTTEDIMLRTLAALAAGLLLGLDRHLKNKPGDFRAYGIVSVACAMLAMLSLQLFQDFDISKANVSIDPGRMIQGILTGIGFLGAGVILHRGDHVIGTATGATIWATGGIGLAVGFGYMQLAGAAFVAIFLTLVVLGWLFPLIDGTEDKNPPKKKNG